MKSVPPDILHQTLRNMPVDKLVPVFETMGWHRPGEPTPTPEQVDAIIEDAMENVRASPGFAQMLTDALGDNISPDAIQDATVANVETDVESAYEAERQKRRAAARKQRNTILAVVAVVIVIGVVFAFLVLRQG